MRTVYPGLPAGAKADPGFTLDGRRAVKLLLTAEIAGVATTAAVTMLPGSCRSLALLLWDQAAKIDQGEAFPGEPEGAALDGGQDDRI